MKIKIAPSWKKSEETILEEGFKKIYHNFFMILSLKIKSYSFAPIKYELRQNKIKRKLDGFEDREGRVERLHLLLSLSLSLSDIHYTLYTPTNSVGLLLSSYVHRQSNTHTSRHTGCSRIVY